MEKEIKYIYLIWNNNGLVAIAEDNEKALYDIISRCWNTSRYNFDYTDIEKFIRNKEYEFSERNVWFIERHPINDLYENGTNL